MDEDIRELKALMQQNIALTEDISHQVRKMRRAALWGRFFQIVWWVAVLAVSGAAYYYYLQPYVGKFESLYSEIQTNSQQSPSINQEVQKFLQSFTRPQ